MSKLSRLENKFIKSLMKIRRCSPYEVPGERLMLSLRAGRLMKLTSSESRLLNYMVKHQKYFSGNPSKSALKLIQLKLIEKTIDFHNFKITEVGLNLAELNKEGKR